ncbi:GEVED domain-containing protein [Nonomuraea insulae]|uniref:GEVED domain-containing protein n=1 Tax=Nonomuraea insulae TaxID=1616787 RepID=A0ABW1D719_9ACTN
MVGFEPPPGHGRGPRTDRIPSSVTGWIDFNHNGRFDPLERATAQAAKSATTAKLSWTIPQPPRTGPTWMRLRLTARARAAVSPTGWSDSGEVEDHRVQLVRLSAGAAPGR